MSTSRFAGGIDSPTQRFLNALGESVRQAGNGWMACCPAHEDRTPSLSIRPGDNGGVLVKCFAGCSEDDICKAVGLSRFDLMPPKERPPIRPKPKGPTYPSDDQAIKALERQLGIVDNFWEYHAADGKVVGYVLRWDLPDGKKTIRPVSLHPDGWRTAGMAEPRPLYRLPDVAESQAVVFVTEGEKAADAARSIGLIATCSAHGSKSAGQTDWSPLAGKNVAILPDNDSPGREYADKVASILSKLSPVPTVKVVELPDLPDGGDIWDWLEERDAGEPDELRESIETLLAAADVWKPRQSGNGSANGRPRKAADRAPIEVTADEHIVIAETLDALADDPSVYHRAGELVHVIREPGDKEEAGIERFAGTPRVMNVSPGYLRERMAALCYFYKLAKSEDDTFQQRQCAPPGFAVNSIHTRGFWPTLRPLAGITETPVLRPDGSVLDSPGWDRATGLIYEPGSDVPKIPDNPSRDDAVRALNTLMSIVADFPFAKPAHSAAWLAGLLTVLGRRAFRGPAPLFLMDANVRGSGKSLLTDLIAIITTGRNMPRFANPQSDEEARKRITALAICGDPIVLIDNIASTLGGAALDAALTSTVWKDRILGQSRIVECPLLAVWFATGNNVILKADTSRRVVHCRIESPEENPEERTNFRFPNLLAHARNNRLALLAAGLTILRAYVAAGKPDPDEDMKPWGSFEGWSGLIRNCLVWLGVDDPGETRRELADASDSDATALRALFEGWPEIDPHGDGLTSSDIAKRLSANPDRYDTVRSALLELCSAKGQELNGRVIGNKLRHFRGRVIGNKRLEILERKINRWRVADVQ